MKLFPTSVIKPLHKAEAQQICWFKFHPRMHLSEGQRCCVGEPDGFKTQFMLRPSLTLYQRCQPFDKHIKSIPSGSQVTSISSHLAVCR